MIEPAVKVIDLVKTYGALRALDGISLTIEAGEIFGILGHNGAGKSTLVSMLAGLNAPDSGSLSVLGMNPQKSGRQLRERLGLQLQEAELQDQIKVGEAIDLYASFYRNPADTSHLLRDWGLESRKDARFAQLSGGQKQRLFIALSLVNSPDLVILDELTTGLDPRARHDSWDLVLRIRDAGATVVLVTHFMEEAQTLCDRVAIMTQGRIASLGTIDEVVRRKHGTLRVAFSAPETFDTAALRGLPGLTSAGQTGRTVQVDGTGYLMSEVAQALERLAVNPPDLHMEAQSLEEVFLEESLESAPSQSRQSVTDRPGPEGVDQ